MLLQKILNEFFSRSQNADIYFCTNYRQSVHLRDLHCHLSLGTPSPFNLLLRISHAKNTHAYNLYPNNSFCNITLIFQDSGVFFTSKMPICMRGRQFSNILYGPSNKNTQSHNVRELKRSPSGWSAYRLSAPVVFCRQTRIAQI